MRGINFKTRALRGVRKNAPVASRYLIGCIVLSLVLTISFTAYAESALEGQSALFGWPGLSDGKFASGGQFTRPQDALFDSAHSFDALHYRLDLDFPLQSDFFGGAVTLRLRVIEQTLDEARLHMVGLVADSAFVNGTQTLFSRDDTSVIIDLGSPRQTGETLEVRVVYHDTVAGRGYYHFERNSYTMAEPQDARWWFPCYDEPWDKATSEIYATVPESCLVGSNGLLEGVSHDPVGHTKTYHWVNSVPISTYLINLIIGDYAAWNDYYVTPGGDSLPIFNMVWREDSVAAAFDFATVPEMIRVYSELFYPYPFVKYGQGAVAPYYYGAMEHQTMTTMNRSWITGDRSNEGGYAHELAHMWWGDFVTLADWRHIWLNEGFATYSSALFDESFHGPEAFATAMSYYRDVYLSSDQSGQRFPLFNPPDLFAVAEYVKGAWVLHMLRGIMGDSLFFAGLHQYAGQFAYANASTWEFRDVMEAVWGQDLGWFFQEWIFDRGYPEYNYAWSYRSQGEDFIVHLEIEQVQINAPIFRMPLKIRIDAGNNYDFVVDNYQRVQSYEFSVLTQPMSLSLDPDNVILKRALEVTSINDERESNIPGIVSLENVYPNPFNSSVNISFSIEGISQPAHISIFDIQGRLLKSLFAGELSPGKYIISWNGRDDFGKDVASGIYLLRLYGRDNNISRKVTYLR